MTYFSTFVPEVKRTKFQSLLCPVGGRGCWPEFKNGKLPKFHKSGGWEGVVNLIFNFCFGGGQKYGIRKGLLMHRDQLETQYGGILFENLNNIKFEF